MYPTNRHAEELYMAEASNKPIYSGHFNDESDASTCPITQSTDGGHNGQNCSDHLYQTMNAKDESNDFDLHSKFQEDNQTVYVNDVCSRIVSYGSSNGEY